jgi:hypothetical protein
MWRMLWGGEKGRGPAQNSRAMEAPLCRGGFVTAGTLGRRRRPAFPPRPVPPRLAILNT